MDQKLCYRALFLRAKLTSECKNSTSLNEFKTKIINWKGGKICPCRLCKDYLPDMDASDMKEAWNFSYSYKNFAETDIKNKNFALCYIHNFSDLYRNSHREVF